MGHQQRPEPRPGDQTPPPPQALSELFSRRPDQVAEAVARALSDTSTVLELPPTLPATGRPADDALGLVTPYLRGAATDLGHPGYLAHMDPPTPWVTWVAALLGASTNQNLLHPDTAPAARPLEATVVDWLSAPFGMDTGHLTPGSTVANLTALWAARDAAGATTVVASSAAHLSIAKAATILGMGLIEVAPPAGGGGALTGDALAAGIPADLDPARTAVVVTAGTTSVGAIDALEPLVHGRRPAWVHVDAAWAGPLRLSARHRHRLAGIEQADSVAVSAHKWLFQPKESALVLFADGERANRAIARGGAYLQAPNIGLLGSHGTAAAPLAATLVHLGADGVAGLIDHSMSLADELLRLIGDHRDLEAYGPNHSGVVAWRHRSVPAARLVAGLQAATVSTVTLDGQAWLRSVAANPLAEPGRVVDAVLDAADRAGGDPGTAGR